MVCALSKSRWPSGRRSHASVMPKIALASFERITSVIVGRSRHNLDTSDQPSFAVYAKVPKAVGRLQLRWNSHDQAVKARANDAD